MIADKRMLRSTDYIHDLVDLVEEQSPETMDQQEVIVIDGRGYDRVLRSEEKIYNLHDVFEEGPGLRSTTMDEEVRKMALDMAEKIARELVPGIAERVIREEIEKLKKDLDEES